MQAITDWYEHCVVYHKVDPTIFVTLYLAKSVVYYYFLYRVVRSIQRRHWAPVPTWILICVIVNMAPWIYVYYYGENLPGWFHGLFVAVLATTAGVLGWNIKKKLSPTPS